MEEPEDVYRFQDLDSDQEVNGVLVDSGYEKNPNARHLNPDELYFNDMDLRDWERRTGAFDGLLYGDEYDYEDLDGYYEDPIEYAMSQEEYEKYEENIFQEVLGKIRHARSTGEPDVQLTPEELDIYRSKLSIPRAPAAQPGAGATRIVSASVPETTNSAIVSSAMNDTPAIPATRPGSSRASKGKRSSLFASKSKKEKPTSRRRAPSNVSQPTVQAQAASHAHPVQHAPGFIVPGPNGQPMYAPVNSFPDHMVRDPLSRPWTARDYVEHMARDTVRQPSTQNAYAEHMLRDAVSRARASPPRNTIGSSFMSNFRPSTPLRWSVSKEMPGGFPSEEPQQVQEDHSSSQEHRPSSSSNASPISPTSSNNDWQHPTEPRSRSSSAQQPSKLVPFPVPEYHHHSTEPYQYQMAGQVVPPTSSSYATSSQQPPPTRRVSLGPADTNYTVMPRRVPVPVQRANAPVQPARGSFSDPAVAQRGFGIRGEASDGEEDPGGIVVDVAPQADERSYKLQTVKPAGKGGDGAGGGRANERRRRAAHTKKKS